MLTIRCLLRALPLLVLRARLSFLLWAVNLLLAAIVLFPLSRAFERTFGHSVAGRTTGEGRFVEFAWQDFHLGQGELLAQAERAFSGTGLIALLLSFTVLSGGTFALLAQAGSGSSVREFLAGAGRLFARYLRLLVLFAAGCCALHWVNVGLTMTVNRLLIGPLDRASPSRHVGLLLHLKSAYMLLLFGWLIAATGLAKARAALHDERSMVRAFLGGWKAALSSPLASTLLAAIGPLLFTASIGAYAWLRDRLGEGAETTVAGRTIPTLAAYLILSQLAAWLQQAAQVVWTACFVEFESARRAAASAPPGPAAGSEAQPLGTAAPARAGLLLALAFALPVARARGQDGARLPSGPFPASYDITFTLDPRTKSLIGSERVTFTNTGATPVGELAFHLYPNAFASRDSVWMQERRLRIGRDPLDGVPASALGRLSIGLVTLDQEPLAHEIDGTVMRVPLPGPVAPGASVSLWIEFTTRLAAIEVSGRGGFQGDHYDGMQWYPKLGVLRDGAIDCPPFHADTEFFSDFGDYDVTILAPRRFVVGASGRLVEEADAPAAPVVDEPLTRRRFVANAVHDFAWCADPHFEVVEGVHDYATHRVAIRYLCQPYAREKRDLVLRTTRLCLERYGEWFAPYPYDTLTIDGLPMGVGGGMEYPTLFTISQGFPNHLAWIRAATEEPAGVTAHEFGHQFWYGLLASDEFREAWLDEGVNTYVTTKIEEELWASRTSSGRSLQAAEWNEVLRPFLEGGVTLRAFGQELGLVQLCGFESSPFTTVRRGRRGDPTLLGFEVPIGRRPGFGEIRALRRRESFVPIAGTSALADVSFDLVPGSYTGVTYSKAALALATLEAVFGWDAVRSALREYTLRCRFRHPTGAQFQDVLREVIPAVTAARDVPIEPFLREMWGTNAVLDLAVTHARSTPVRAAPGAPAGFQTEVIVENLGTMRLPSTILLRFEDGTETSEPWPAERRFLVIDRVTPSKLVSAEVDPGHRLLLDVDWCNNGRTVERNADAARRFDAAALFWIESALSFLRMLAGP
jgi:hypothetical protein